PPRRRSMRPRPGRRCAAQTVRRARSSGAAGSRAETAGSRLRTGATPFPCSTVFAVDWSAFSREEANLTGSEDFDGSAAFVAHARRHHMTRRLPRFAALWLGVAVGWNVVLCLESLLTPLLAVLILAVQAAVAGGAIAVARAEPTVPGVLGVVMVACAFLGTSTIVVFAAVGGSGDFLAYVLLTLYLSAALAFMWGWRAEITLLVVTVIPWLLAIPALRFHFPTSELVTAIVTGSVICLAI